VTTKRKNNEVRGSFAMALIIKINNVRFFLSLGELELLPCGAFNARISVFEYSFTMRKSTHRAYDDGPIQQSACFIGRK